MNERLKRISQLIADMAIAKATDVELERAIRYSLDILEAEKALNRSALNNNIDLLIDKYSVKKDNGINDLFEKYSKEETK